MAAAARTLTAARWRNTVGNRLSIMISILSAEDETNPLPGSRSPFGLQGQTGAMGLAGALIVDVIPRDS
jgi:hypothetical protein